MLLHVYVQHCCQQFHTNVQQDAETRMARSIFDKPRLAMGLTSLIRLLLVTIKCKREGMNKVPKMTVAWGYRHHLYSAV